MTTPSQTPSRVTSVTLSKASELQKTVPPTPKNEEQEPTEPTKPAEEILLPLSKPDIDFSKVPFVHSRRFLTACVSFFGFSCLYMQRVNLSIAMVCMVTHPEDHLYNTNTTGVNSGEATTVGYESDDYCAHLTLSKKAAGEEGEFDWDKRLQGLLLGSFFWGYLVLQVPGGMLSESIGPKRVVFFTMMPVAVLTILSPISARISPYLFLVVRILIGVGESPLYAAVQALFSRWSAPAERSRLVGISFSGGQFGNALIFPIGGYLCSSLGWDAVFYSMGVLGCVWCIAWWLLVDDSPIKTQRISNEEKDYLVHHCNLMKRKTSMAKPWKAIFRSLPFWAILIAHTCGNYGLYMLLTQIPTYMKEVLKFDLKSNGFYSMLPYLVMWFCITVGGLSSDFLVSRNIVRRVVARKLMTALGTFLPAACMWGMSYMDCTQRITAVALLCGTVGLSGFTFAGYMVNHGDIAPQHAGTLFGITNVAATFPGILAPYVVGALTPNKTREEWQTAFFIAVAIYIVGGIFYTLFADAEIQPWAMILPSKQSLNINEIEVDVKGDNAINNSKNKTLKQ